MKKGPKEKEVVLEKIIYIYMCFSLTHMLYKILLLPFIYAYIYYTH